MPTAFDVRALASRVRIELDDSLSAADQESIKAHWVDLANDDDGEPDQMIRAGLNATDSSDGAFVVKAGTPEALAQRLTSEVTISAIGGLRGQALMLHASAVALDDGRVIGFVGPSGRGKTTAARELGRTHAYVTDETLAVRNDGSVIAYPKPLSIGSAPGAKSTESASTLGLRGAPFEGLQLAALVLLDRRPSVEQPFVESVSLTDAVAALVPQTSHLSEMERPLRTLVETVVSTGGVRRVVYSEASTLPALIEDMLRPDESDAPALMDVPSLSQYDCGCSSSSSAEPVDSQTATPSGVYQRATYSDALMIDDTLVVMASGSVVVLAGVGPSLWFAADGLTEDELRETVLQEFPDPPAGVDVDAVIADAVHGMEHANILVRT